MPKKIICLSLLILFLTCPTKSFAEDFDMSSALTDLPDLDNIWQGQKQITNKEFEQVMTELEKRKGKKKEKPMPGNSMNTNDAGNFLSSFNETYPLLNLPTPLYLGDVIVPVGHYKIVGTKENGNGKIILNFIQGHSIIAKIPAYETDDDFNELSINFIKTETLGMNSMKLMYGSMKFNAFAYVKY